METYEYKQHRVHFMEKTKKKRVAEITYQTYSNKILLSALDVYNLLDCM